MRPAHANRDQETSMTLTTRAALAAAVALVLCAPSALAKGGTAVFKPAAEVKFADVPGFPGVQMAVVQGDPAKGSIHMMLKFTGGFAAPVHHHTSDHHGTVVAGTLVLTSGGKEVKLPPGSYFAFTGKMPHSTKCEAGADCVVAVDARGKWDVVAEDAKKA
jgi:quercetin dioxygenase-like cupin family protein